MPVKAKLRSVASDDNAAAADISRVRPVADTVTVTDMPASQIAPVTPAPAVTAATPDRVGG